MLLRLVRFGFIGVDLLLQRIGTGAIALSKAPYNRLALRASLPSRYKGGNLCLVART
ncbi:MAG: hypothetical protein AAFY57_19805 [Cyanobacteria bacterium J06642_2]